MKCEVWTRPGSLALAAAVSIITITEPTSAMIDSIPPVPYEPADCGAAITVGSDFPNVRVFADTLHDHSDPTLIIDPLDASKLLTGAKNPEGRSRRMKGQPYD